TSWANKSGRSTTAERDSPCMTDQPQPSAADTVKASPNALSVADQKMKLTGSVAPDKKDEAMSVEPQSKVIDLGDNVSLEVVYIPPGKFKMGSTPEEKAWATSQEGGATPGTDRESYEGEAPRAM